MRKLITTLTFLPLTALAAPQVLFVGDNPKDAAKGMRAAQTIMQRADRKREDGMSVDLQTGAYVAKSLHRSLSTLYLAFHEKPPEINARTRLFMMSCKVDSGGYDNFWLREQDIGNVKAVFRQSWTNH